VHISTLCAETLFVTHAPLRAALGRLTAGVSVAADSPKAA